MHKHPKKGRFSGTAGSMNTDDLSLLYVYRAVFQNFFLFIGKAHILCRSPCKSQLLALRSYRNLLYHRCFLQDRENPFTAGQRLIQVVGKAG